jgi:hypothetical protein
MPNEARDGVGLAIAGVPSLRPSRCEPPMTVHAPEKQAGPAALAHQFGVAAVAEGLEDMADIQAIRDMGCDVVQGYYFARPMPKPKFIDLLGDGAAAHRQWLV